MKKKTLVTNLLATLLCGTVFIACNTNNDPVPLPEKIQKLISADWKIESITTVKQSEPGTDSLLTKDCMDDDLIGFAITGVYDFKDGAVQCDSSIFSYSKGFWGYDLTKDSVQLAATTPAAPYRSWKVLTLNDSVLKVTYTDSTVPAKKITKTILFKH